MGLQQTTKYLNRLGVKGALGKHRSLGLWAPATGKHAFLVHSLPYPSVNQSVHQSVMQ